MQDEMTSSELVLEISLQDFEQREQSEQLAAGNSPMVNIVLRRGLRRGEPFPSNPIRVIKGVDSGVARNATCSVVFWALFV